jgi:hypothetical protein
MPSKRVQIIVRCEDLQQQCFIYRYLLKKGFHGHDIQIKHSPSGKGAATQWVLKQYPIEVKALRSGPPVSKALISIIDADVDTIEQRKRQHDDALVADGQKQRDGAEKIAVVVPKRNIETWIHHLFEEPNTNETITYPRFRGEERKCAPAAERFAQRCPNQMQTNDLPSLLDGCAELQRIVL